MTAPLATLPRSVSTYEDARAEVIRDLLVYLSSIWPPGQPMDPREWFEKYAEGYADAVILAQMEAALLAAWSVGEALAAQGSTKNSEYPLDVLAFTSTDGQGRPVMGQAYASAGMVGAAGAGAAAAGASGSAAIAEAWPIVAMSLARATQTIISDTSRSVKSAEMVSRNVGWIRTLTPPSCPRCAILAGKFHRNPTAGFNRHPGCDCTQVPYDEDRKHPDFQGLFVEPKDYFDTMNQTEQDKWLGKANAQAVRDGADFNQVINARRGMSTVTDKFGQRTVVTTEGTSKKGWAAQYLRKQYGAKLEKQPGSRYRQMNRPRLMPEEIYKIADGDRDIAMNLLHKNGFYLDASPTLTSKMSFYPRERELAEAAKRARQKLQARGLKLNS
ncbi:hypothetical protein [Corynebacterium callunae]|uniref:hypothetical protein n=1 Tax=Corynebacterium callunae TaxID=1721 RepID=UPI001FFE56F4|nr:hypothetical protein [Corynebacterium callunae]MCK2199189.1 hypothetical protein [Corynebacterium callunae]